MADGYVRELESLDSALKRHNKAAKELREKKKKTQEHLYNYMKRNDLEEYEGYKLSKIAPKPKIVRKKKR